MKKNLSKNDTFIILQDIVEITVKRRTRRLLAGKVCAVL